MLFLAARAQRPNLTAFQRLVTNTALALKLRSGHELLNTFGPHRVAEVGVAELGRTNAFLLLLDAATHLQCQPHSPFEVFIADQCTFIWINQF